MSNKINHRRGDGRRSERREPLLGCCGEGHSGAIGKAAWKDLSRRHARRTGRDDLKITGRSIDLPDFDDED